MYGWVVCGGGSIATAPRKKRRRRLKYIEDRLQGGRAVDAVNVAK